MGNRNLPYLRIERGNLVWPAHCCQPTTRHLCQLTTTESLQDNLPQSIHCGDNTLWVAGGRTGQAGRWVGGQNVGASHFHIPRRHHGHAELWAIQSSGRLAAAGRQQQLGVSIFTSGSRGRGCENGAHQPPPPPCPPPNGLNTATVTQQPEL